MIDLVQRFTEEGGIPAYGKIYALGHPALKSLLHGPVSIQEKVDGSQLSFAKLNDRLRIRSKGREIFVEAPDAMFKAGVEYVQSIQDKLVEGWVYRCEYLRVPKHNSLCYTRIPLNHIVLYDVMTQRETYGNRNSIETAAKLLDIEPVQHLFEGEMDLHSFQILMNTESSLGGQKIEGLVIKNYSEFCQKTGHVLMGKYVSEHFKEVHNKEWKLNNPGRQDIMVGLIGKYKTDARWEKAVFHLRDEGLLQNAPQDIGALMKLVAPDVAAEHKEEIQQELWKYFWPQLSRALTAGLAEWYKQRLVTKQFEESDANK